MWLLNTETYSLKEFSEASKSPYAILSHRWEEEEISFKQIQDEEYMKYPALASWNKIRAFCDLAASKNLAYGWVDMCCIDRSSSAELSESINSMYKWYQEAVLCIVYLRDVTRKSTESFEISEWFTRGWTLQELLAPKTLEFYDSNWEYLGTRKHLCRRIASRTGIPIPVIYSPVSFPLSFYSIAERMRWAAKRRTTRSEDVAYCLLGVFDVHMPLLYGEGGQNAFERLQQKIMRKSDDESIFAWSKQAIGDLETVAFSQNPGGALAGDPSWFERSTDIESGRWIDRKPYAMTNKGLQIELELWSSSVPKRKRRDVFNWFDRILLAPLSCKSGNRRLCIVLWSLTAGGSTYSRMGICYLPEDAMPLPRDTQKEIFIDSQRQQPFTQSKEMENCIKKIKTHLSRLNDFQSDESLAVLGLDEADGDEVKACPPPDPKTIDANIRAFRSLGVSETVLKEYEKACTNELQQRDA